MADDDFEQQESELRESLRTVLKTAINLRSKDREFHGLNREFLYYQAQMIADFEKSADIKHPRDIGTAREQILRKFLAHSGLVPKRYGVSNRSVRVVSTSGHSSQEIDIALTEALDAITLMNREDIYGNYPVDVPRPNL